MYAAGSHLFARRVRIYSRGGFALDRPRNPPYFGSSKTQSDELRSVDKTLYVNGRALAETSYVRHKDPRVFPDRPFLEEERRRRDNWGPVVVPAGQYFCMGDNRDHSYDSRYWGPVPARYLK